MERTEQHQDDGGVLVEYGEGQEYLGWTYYEAGDWYLSDDEGSLDSGHLIELVMPVQPVLARLQALLDEGAAPPLTVGIPDGVRTYHFEQTDDGRFALVEHDEFPDYPKFRPSDVTVSAPAELWQAMLIEASMKS